MKDLLALAEKQELEARAFGFYWECIEQLLEQIQSECKEIREAWDHKQPHLQEEVGDLLLAALSLATFCNFDPHETLQRSIEKFQKRYDRVVALAKQDGLSNLKGKTMQELLHYWQHAKNHTDCV